MIFTMGMLEPEAPMESGVRHPAIILGYGLTTCYAPIYPPLNLKKRSNGYARKGSRLLLHRPHRSMVHAGELNIFPYTKAVTTNYVACLTLHRMYDQFHARGPVQPMQ